MTTNRAWCLPAWGALVLLVTWAAWPAGAASPLTARSKADRVNVRSRPGYVGEIITQLSRGQEVRVLGTNVLSKPAADEPPVWFRIELPSDAPLWVSAEYVNADTRAVLADVLNVRAGPGYDFASVARVRQGAVLKFRGGLKDGWVEIEAPPGAHGFVPSDWMTFEASLPTPVPPATPGAPGTATPPATSPASAPTTPGAPDATPTTTTPSPAPAQGTPPTSVASVSTNLPSVPVGGAAPATPRAAASSDHAWFEQFVVKSPAPADQPVTPPPGAEVTPAVAPSPAATPSTTAAAPPVETTSPPASTTESVAVISPPAGSDDVAAEAAPARRRIARSPRAQASMPPTIRDSGGVQLPPGLEESEVRWVRREGLIIRPSNIQAPTFYALQARDSRKTVNFLFSTRAEPINWSELRGRVVIVSGREYLDHRFFWQGIPLLDVEEIEGVR